MWQRVQMWAKCWDARPLTLCNDWSHHLARHGIKSEPTKSFCSTSHYDDKIFSLATLLSSKLLYNRQVRRDMVRGLVRRAHGIVSIYTLRVQRRYHRREEHTKGSLLIVCMTSTGTGTDFLFFQLRFERARHACCACPSCELSRCVCTAVPGVAVRHGPRSERNLRVETSSVGGRS